MKVAFQPTRVIHGVKSYVGSRPIAVLRHRSSHSTVAEFEAVARADFWAFDSMRRGPLPQTLPLTRCDWRRGRFPVDSMCPTSASVKPVAVRMLHIW